MGRLYNLDYLRGMAAFGIMIYHYLSWSSGKFMADSFMGRLGIYGVSIFYVLSGLTLFYVYYDKFELTQKEVISFFKKRVFRIFPLLWLVTIISIILSKEIPNLYDLFLNLTGLFGFINWDKYFSVGVWSIGNELVFYTFFPFFILFAKSMRPMLIILSAILLSLYIYFAFFKLDPTIDLNIQWRNYVNPLNQVFLFLGGFLIGVIFKNVKINLAASVSLLIVGIGLFIFIPAYGNTISLVTGINRLLFTFSCFLICLSFFKLTLRLPMFIHKPLTLLGEASYSVYLLHPIVYGIIGFSSRYIHYSEPAKLTTSVIITLISSYITYEYFEKFFMRLGRKV